MTIIQYEHGKDRMRVIFDFGQSGSVPKGTKMVLEVTDKQRLDKHQSQWDIIVHRHAGNTVILQVRRWD